jgi:hypothetical protein
MSSATQAIFQYAGLKASLFTQNSRYLGISTNQITPPGGAPVVYLLRRFIPPASTFAPLQNYTVAQGDRLDNVAANLIGDPGLYWRICDANTAMAPQDLEVPGLLLTITLPAGIPGPPPGLDNA